MKQCVCGASLPDRAVFCGRCGRRLGGAAQQPDAGTLSVVAAPAAVLVPARTPVVPVAYRPGNPVIPGMSAMICEMCGFSNLLKQGGLYVCQNCGAKYSIEEAKRLIGTARSGSTQDVEKLLLLARRARNDNDDAYAEKYYAMLLEKQPNNWEAAFFHVYFRAVQQVVMNIPYAAYSVAGCLDSTVRLITGFTPNVEKESAKETLISYCVTICDSFTLTARNMFARFPDGSFLNECSEKIVAAHTIYEKLESAFMKYCSTDRARILRIMTLEKNHLMNNRGFFNKAYRKTEMKRLKQAIAAGSASGQPQPPTYTR